MNYDFSFARLNENVQDLIKRYGEPLEIINKEKRKVYKFLINKIIIKVVFKNDPLPLSISYNSKYEYDKIPIHIVNKLIETYDINTKYPFQNGKLKGNYVYKPSSCFKNKNIICNYYNIKKQSKSCKSTFKNKKNQLEGRSSGGSFLFFRKKTSSRKPIIFYSNNGRVMVSSNPYGFIAPKKLIFSRVNLKNDTDKLELEFKRCKQMVKDIEMQISEETKNF